MSFSAPVPVADLSALVESWRGEPSFAIADATRVLGAAGDTSVRRPLASITKLFSAYAALIAIEEGTLVLGEPAGPPGSTVRHLLAHASGLAFDEHTTLSAPGSRRIYSNSGIEVLARHLEGRAGMPFAEYLRMGVLEPLGLGHLDADVNPAHGLSASIDDLVVFGRELLDPTLVHDSTLAEATAPVWPELRGVLPGYGLMNPNPWGLGFEIRGDKHPHWTAPSHPPSTFGHFGGAGSFLWIDPVARLIGAAVGTEPFGDWAVAAWAPTNEAALSRYRSGRA